MFKNKADVAKIETLKEEILILSKEKEKTQREKEKLEEKLETQKEKFNTLTQEVESKIESAIKEKTLDLKIENNKHSSKVDILEQAFANLGFDVKDMKDILNKLVDGLIAKNEINIIK